MEGFVHSGQALVLGAISLVPVPDLKTVFLFLYLALSMTFSVASFP
jgi:hypothetical protein